MSDKRRKYSSESSDDSYEREKRKKSKYHHKEHRRKHKKEHRREEKRSSDRKKYRRDREKHRSSKYDDRERRDSRERKETDSKYKSKHEHDNNKASIVAETKKSETISADTNPVNSIIKKQAEDIPSTSTNSDITLPPYYNSSVVNAQKFAEQQKKRKLLWQNKKTEEATKWTNLKFSQDNDGTKANKFMRLMGIKDSKEENSSQPPQASKSDEDNNKSDELLKNMEQQYEVARNITHLSRGFGLGFK